MSHVLNKPAANKFENVLFAKSMKDLINTQFYLPCLNYEWIMIWLFTLQD